MEWWFQIRLLEKQILYSDYSGCRGSEAQRRREIDQIKPFDRQLIWKDRVGLTGAADRIGVELSIPVRKGELSLGISADENLKDRKYGVFYKVKF